MFDVRRSAFVLIREWKTNAERRTSNAERRMKRESFHRECDHFSIVVNDGDLSATRWQGIAPATLIGPASVEIQLAEIEPIGAGDVRLTASAGNGIVAVDDGGTWGGVSALSLPFP